jgi:predicted glycosyltransferase involved in capsule biosynthesis
MSKISFCVTSMNRLEHIKKTILVNITDALKDHHDIEFILLDYNSSDTIEQWVKEKLLQHIENKTLVYFKTTQPESYHRSHSRNMAFRLASGDILVNLDADNFIGKGFVKYIREKMNESNFLAVDENGNQLKDTLGRICVWKKDFERARGYDERMSGYGFEDLDFKTRLIKLGLKLLPIKNSSYLKSVPHDNFTRIKNESIFKNIHKVAVQHLKPFESALYFFYKNDTYEKATLVDIFFKGGISEKINVINELQQVQMTELHEGMYAENQNYIMIGNQKMSLTDDSYQWFDRNNIQIIQELIYTFSASKNKRFHFNNTQNNNLEINTLGYGKGIAVKNFEEIILL